MTVTRYVKRIMWLINHTTLRAFELPQLKRLGITEIFTPKNFPYDEGNLSASVTYEFDKTLNLSEAEIQLLNEQEWYKEASSEAWEIVNRHFDTIFLAFFPTQLESILRNFKGTIVLRAFGLAGEETYSNLIRQLGGVSLQKRVMDAGVRFWFGMGYSQLADKEERFIAEHAVYLPVGLKNIDISNKWQGNDNHILFVCPRIATSPYFRNIYEKFKKNFDGMPYRIGGAQAIPVGDPNVLGFLSTDAYHNIMQQSRVMFYHSQEEPNNIHYHPFEAIRVGMPLVFMAGGMLDTMGGSDLPGRCKNVAGARRKIQRLIKGDKKLLKSIKESQAVLLKQMNPEYCAEFWKVGIETIREKIRLKNRSVISRKKKIAVILPQAFKGGTLRGAIALVKALHHGSRQCSDDAEIILAHINEPGFYSDDDFDNIKGIASIRPHNFVFLSSEEAKSAMYMAGFQGWQPEHVQYLVPFDGMDYMMDCDHWIFVSDRVATPILPIKSYTVIVYDYIQRYVNFLPQNLNNAFISFARSAEKVWVTTKFTYNDAREYAGINKNKLVHVPMLMPDFPIGRYTTKEYPAAFTHFIWTTNVSLHKNHVKSIKALQIYYDKLDGKLDCKVTGFDTKLFNKTGDNDAGLHIYESREILRASKKLKRRIYFLGNLPDQEYRQLLSRSAFLWHSAKIDNGTFAVIESACLGVPSLSSDYPAMREINENFSLQLVWQNANCPEEMACQLKYMEKKALALREKLPTPSQLKDKGISNHSETYWQELLKCL